MQIRIFSTWIAKYAVTLILCVVPVVAQLSTTDSGWDYLLSNDDVSAIDHFSRSLAKNDRDQRAWLGLSYAYGLSLDDSLSWRAFSNALESSSDPHPYLYASLVTRRFLNQQDNAKSDIVRWLERVIEKPDSLRILQAMAWEHLAGIMERRGNISKAKEFYDKIGAVTQWRLIGPFHNVSGAGYDRVFAPRTEDDTAAVYDGLSGVKIRWHTPTLYRNDYWIDYARYYPTVRAAFYATTYVWSEVEQRVHVRIGTSGGFKIILNDSLVHGTSDEHNNDLDTYIAEVTLNEGWNRILIKNTNSEIDACNFLFRITDRTGKPLSNLTYTTLPQKYVRSDPKAVVIENPFIQYFKNAINNNPADMENYFLLAEAYLRNDESMLAERVTETALEISPNSLVTLNLAAEAYSRGSKYDELQSVTERMSTLRPELPSSLTYSFRQAMMADRIDDAEGFVVSMHDVMPLSEDYFNAAIELSQKRDRIQVFNSIVETAFTLHPANFRYTTLYALLTLKGPTRYKGAIAILERHLKEIYSEQALLVLANLHKDAGDFRACVEIFDKLLELSPAAPGYYSILSDLYSSRKEYDLAISSLLKAIAIAPGVSTQWYKAGVVYRSLGNAEESANAFRSAIKFDPSNFDAREALRNVLQMTSPFNLIPSRSIDALISRAPTADLYPNSKAVYLLDDTRRVVYDGSNCEVVYEILMRVFTNAGIDQYKEMTLPGSGAVDFAVDKAVVRKANGKEIPADRQGTHVVFKSLEPGDFIYMKTKTRETAHGELAKHFYDEKLYNTFVPVLSCTYSLIVPQDQSFNWSLSGSDLQPETTSTPYGDLYVWSLQDLPEMVYEEGMPGISDAGIVLQISSFKTWGDIVTWYSDIARAKIKPSLEVSDLMDGLFSRKKQFSEAEIIKGVYQFITSEIRYSNVPFRQSGIVPQKARDVLATRIGDCKDVATLCISMLAERDISAYHVLVQTNTSPLQRKLLPSIPFDHCIVLVESKTGPIFIDLTADNIPIGSLPSGDIDALALVIKPGWIVPLTLHRNKFSPSNLTITSTVKLNSNLSASIKQDLSCTGAATQWYRANWKDISMAEVERLVLEDLSARNANVTLDSLVTDDVNILAPEFNYTVWYTIKDFLHQAGDFLILDIPWFQKNMPDGALAYPKRTYPYVFKNYFDTLRETVTISPPVGYALLNNEYSSQTTNDVFSYALGSSQKAKTLSISRVNVWRKEYVLPENYAAYKSQYNEIVKADHQSLIIVPKGTVVKVPRKRK